MADDSVPMDELNILAAKANCFVNRFKAHHMRKMIQLIAIQIGSSNVWLKHGNVCAQIKDMSEDELAGWWNKYVRQLASLLEHTQSKSTLERIATLQQEAMFLHVRCGPCLSIQNPMHVHVTCKGNSDKQGKWSV